VRDNIKLLDGVAPLGKISQPFWWTEKIPEKMRHWHLALLLFAVLETGCHFNHPPIEIDEIYGQYLLTRDDVEEKLTLNRDGTFNYYAKVGTQTTTHTSKWQFKIEDRRSDAQISMLFPDYVSANPDYPYSHSALGMVLFVSRDGRNILFCYNSERDVCLSKERRK
jgi:hypothetical protein